MKNIFLTLGIGLLATSCVMYSEPNAGNVYRNGGYADNNQWNNGYSSNDYFPDDYYYEYPNDYYRDDYYQSFYNDYHQSIAMVNWNSFFREMSLTQMQINAILDLNNQFATFGVWNNYYRMNPNRWYYDRFYALERILGSRVYAVYINRYYRGVSPVTFYVNYWQTHYRPRYYNYYVVPQYRNVNINNYRVDREVYHRNVGTNYGWNQPRSNSYNPGGFKENNSRTYSGSNTNTQRVGGFRTETNATGRTAPQPSTQSSRSGSYRAETTTRTQTPANSNRSGGFRTESSSQSSTARQQPSSNSSRNSGMRTAPSNGNRSTSGTSSSSSRSGSSSGNRTGGGRF